jgi:gliding motility-associated-like protein
MKIKQYLLLALWLPLTAGAQKVVPSATYVDENNNMVDSESDFTAQAPLDVSFRANPKDLGEHTAAFEWHFRKEGDAKDLLVRYEEDTQYTFKESGTFLVILKAKLTDIAMELDSAVIKVTISESRLVMPNAFSPNDDLKNDIYGAKGVCDPNSTEHYRSIVEFHGYIFNRWGQKLFEWTDVSKGWDGKHNGTPVKEGVYFVRVIAKGADGREYNIKKDINLLRSYTEGTGTSSNP